MGEKKEELAEVDKVHMLMTFRLVPIHQTWSTSPP